MKNFKYLLPSLLWLFTACDEKLDINSNPVQPVTASSNLLLPAIQSNMAYHLYSHARFSTYHSQYITSETGTRAIEDRWDYNQITRLGAWRWHYFDVGSNAKNLIRRAESEGSSNYAGIAKIMLGFSYLMASDNFGDMPVTEAYTGDFSPRYNTQEEVLAEVVRLTDEGIQNIENTSAVAKTVTSSSDLIYQGELDKWVSFAHAVKAKRYLRTASFETGGYDKVLAEVNAALSNWKDAIFFFSSSPQRDWERNLWGQSRPNPQWNFAEIVNQLDTSVPTTLLMNYLTVDPATMTYDPRLYKLTSPGANNKYQGARPSRGIEGVNRGDFPSLYRGYWTSDNSPFPYILREELLFIKAEAAFYKEDKATAFQAYQEGILQNMVRLGVSQEDIAAYMASAKVKNTADELVISDIMTQKYIALYLQAETWADMRRYQYQVKAYPGIERPRSGSVLAEFGSDWIQRLPYDPQTEYIYNPQEIARLGASSRNWVTKKTWWAENSKL